VVRRARADDAGAIAEVFIASRAGMTYLPAPPSDDAFRDFIAGEIMRRDEVWVSEQEGRVVGFLTLESDLLDHLYVRPDDQGGGIGSELLDLAKSRRPQGFRLWVFQRNEGARRFYERHGLELTRLTEGRDNMEREPDALYAWRP
jgi:ribosomal protein S18 acetylase RimI-like enzyme